MKATLWFFLSIALFANCSRYQYGTISSSLPKDDHGLINFENDTVRITYSFKGYNLPVQVKVFNKTSLPLTVHWDKSAIIFESRALPITTNGAHLEATVVMSTFAPAVQTYPWPQISTSVASINGHITAPMTQAFIPPMAYTESTLHLQLGKVRVPETQMERYTQQTPYGRKQFRRKQFAETESPVSFRSFITLSLGNTEGISFSVDNRFWVSEVYEGVLRAGQNGHYRSRNDIFYSKNHTGLLVGAGVLGTAIVIGLYAGGSYAPSDMTP
jgi:hypothetical protein